MGAMGWMSILVSACTFLETNVGWEAAHRGGCRRGYLTDTISTTVVVVSGYIVVVASLLLVISGYCCCSVVGPLTLSDTCGGSC